MRALSAEDIAYFLNEQNSKFNTRASKAASNQLSN